jgi:hypothetical protein
MIDRITELATETGTMPSFPAPNVLRTRIATAETFGIVPLSSQLAEKYNITILPPHRITGMPYHRDLPVEMLTRLSTKSVNRYRYLQLRQRSLHPITPVHTIAEYTKFKQHIHDTQIRRNTKKIYPTYEANKMIDFDKFAVFWNSEVEKQDRTEVDSNKRLYYKLPSQLERHHKKTLAWKSERSTLLMGGNAAALKPFRNLLTNDNTTTTLPAQLPPEFLAGEKDHCYNEEGK